MNTVFTSFWEEGKVLGLGGKINIGQRKSDFHWFLALNENTDELWENLLVFIVHASFILFALLLESGKIYVHVRMKKVM